MKTAIVIAATLLTIVPAYSETVLDVKVSCFTTRESPRDRDPILGTRVMLRDIIDNNNRSYDITVLHMTSHGLVVSRGDQYVASITSPFPGSYIWDGSYKKNRNLTMKGEFYLNDQGQWHYDETLFKNGVTYYRSWSSCVKTD